MNEIDKFFQKFIGQSQGQGQFLRFSVSDGLVGGSYIGRIGNQDYLKVQIEGLNLTAGGVQSVTAGTGITIGGTATAPIITNSAPDQTVVLTAGSGISITGTYPNFTIAATGSGGTVTSVGASISGALSVSGSPITGSGTLAFTWTGTTGQYVRGDGSLATFPTIPSGTVQSVATAGLISGGTITSTGTITTLMATNRLVGRSTVGAGIMEEISLGTGLSLSAGTLSTIGLLSTTLTSGNIFVGNASNIATSTALTLNASGGTFGLSNIGVLTFPNAATGTRGLLTSTDWNTFNNKLSTITINNTSITSGTSTRVLFQNASNQVSQSGRFTFVDATSGTTGAQLTIGEASNNNTGGQLYLGQSDTHTSAGSLVRFGTTGGSNNQWTLLAFGLGYTAAADAAGAFFQSQAPDRKGTMRFVAATGAGTAQKFQIFCSDFAVGGNTYTASTPNGLRFAPADGMRIDLQTNLQGGDGQGGGGSTNYSRATALLDLGASTSNRASLRVRMGGVAPTGVNLYAGDFYGTGTRDLNLNANFVLPTVGDGIKIKEGANGMMGQIDLIAGTRAILISGVSTSSRAFVTLVTPTGVALTVNYMAVCTAGTLTITANIDAGTINTADTSTLNYIVINQA
jgi:hypothetical protein